MLRALLSALFLLYRERPGLCPEQKGDRRRRKSFVFQRQPSALDVPFEHGNAVAVLVSHKHPPSCGVQCKIPRRPAAATHGGVSVESVQDMGTEITLRLPLSEQGKKEDCI